MDFYFDYCGNPKCHLPQAQLPDPSSSMYDLSFFTFLILRDNCLIKHWCWIGKNYLGWRLGGEYVWLWSALFVSIAAYIALYLWMRGNLVLGKQRLWRCSFRRVKKAEAEVEVDQNTLELRRRSFVMLA